MEPFTPNGGAGVGSKDSYTYHYNDGEEYDYVDAQGDSPKWGQYGIGFPITPTTGIEWLSFDYKGEHADMSFWGALYNQNNTAEVYNDFGIHPIVLGVHKDNEKAARFYLKNGFIKTSCMDGDDYCFIRNP